MVNAAIVSLGWWGKVLVDSVQGKSDNIKFTHGWVRTPANAKEYVEAKGITLVDTYENLIRSKDIDAVVLATQHSKHKEQIAAAAAAGKHVFCEKPLCLTKADAEAAVAAASKAGIVLATGFNRRFAPAIAEMKKRVDAGAFGPLLHVEGTMSAPAGLFLKPGVWRADKNETPAGGLTPMGVHVIDSFIQLFGDIDEVYCQSFHRVVPNDTDDTTSILFRFKNGMSGYLATMLGAPGSFRIQTFGRDATATISKPTLESFTFETREKPGEIEALNWPGVDTVNLELEAFAKAIKTGKPHPVPLDDVIHGTAVMEAIVKSAASHKPEKVG
jgi:predicted dehydrogenase